MQITVPKRKLPAVRIIATLTLCVILATWFSAASGAPAYARILTGDTIVVNKQVTSKKYKIKLYPNANHEVLFFNASGEEGKIYQLFLFDVEGKLVKQANIKNKQTTVLNNIAKGSYLFEVFSDDERIENGQVIIR